MTTARLKKRPIITSTTGTGSAGEFPTLLGTKRSAKKHNMGTVLIYRASRKQPRLPRRRRDVFRVTTGARHDGNHHQTERTPQRGRPRGHLPGRRDGELLGDGMYISNFGCDVRNERRRLGITEGDDELGWLLSVKPKEEARP